MIKKLIFFLFIILTGLIVLTLILTRLKKKTAPTGPAITPAQQTQNFNYQPKTTKPTSQPTTTKTSTTNLSKEEQELLKQITNQLPLETDDFIISYDAASNTYFVYQKTAAAKEKLNQWLTQNKLLFLQNKIVFTTNKSQVTSTTTTTATTSATTTKPSRELELLLELFKGIMNIYNIPTVVPISGFPATPIPTSTSEQPTNPPTIIGNLGLPQPVAEGVNGYQALKAKIESNSNALWAVKQLLEGEKYYENRGGNIIRYLTTAWIWFENGASSWPDPYQINCNDNRPGYTSEVNFFCNSTNFQIAGYQAAERKNDYINVFRRLYNDLQLATIMQAVVDNSSHASSPKWKYNPQTIPANITLNNISPGSNFFSDRAQFYTLILGKDPKMVAALNSFAVNQNFLNQLKNANDAHKLYGYIGNREVQLISNMIAALYLIDGGSFSSGGNNQSVVGWAQTISGKLEPGSICDGWNCRMVSNITSGSYQAAIRQGLDNGVDQNGRYWCTQLVIDAFNLSGKSGLSLSHEGVANMTRFWQQSSGYHYLNYAAGNRQTVLSQVTPGCAMFQERKQGVYTGYEHVAVIKEIRITNGNGYIITYDANGPAKTSRYIIDNWQVINNFYPYVSFGC